MRLLLIHAKYFEYRVTKKALKKNIEHPETPREASYENVLVVFTTIEEGDTYNTVKQAVEEILNVARQVKPSTILIYPYAHLSSHLAKPVDALKILDKLTEELDKQARIPVSRAPFGYYKEFKLHCYGHPLAELSKTIIAKEEIAIEKSFIVENNELVEIDNTKARVLLDKLVNEQLLPDELLKLMRKFGYSAINTAVIYLPQFHRMLKIINETVRYIIQKHGYPEEAFVYQIPLEPILSNINTSEEVKMYYQGLLDRETVEKLTIGKIRGVVNESTIVVEEASPKLSSLNGKIDLISNVVEKATGYSWNDLKHLVIVSKEYFDVINSLLLDFLSNGDIVIVLNNSDKIVLVGVLELMNKIMPITYFEIKINNVRNITRIFPLISFERALLIHLLKSLTDYKSGKTPSLPVWLAPIQVRIIPIREDFVEYSIGIAKSIRDNGFRADVDDRMIGLGRRIREAGKEWIPYIVIIGEREVKSNTLNIRIRRTNDQLVLTLEEFLEHLSKETTGYKPIALEYPLRVSMRTKSLYTHIYQ